MIADIFLGVVLGVLLAAAEFAVGLIPIVVARWLIEGWMPVATPDEPYDFATDTIAGIPVEEIGLPEGIPTA